jgi:hypothetical protein
MSPPTRFFYLVKPLIPRGVQLALRRQLILRKRKQCADVWPILESAGRLPAGWEGWPEGKQFAFVLTHDVDTAKGHDNCLRLADLEESYGFRSSFNFVPERYRVSSELRHELLRRGFEVGIHGLVHDGKLFTSRKIFKERAEKINKYLQEWECSGFRSPAMHHNLEWICELNVQYDASTFDTDPFEPQPDGMGTIFPFCIARDGGAEGYVELPYTLVQDFTLLVLMREKGIDIWTKKLDWIAQKEGMALLNVHPDYMNFGDTKVGREEYPAEHYAQLLDYVKQKYDTQYWHVLPREIAQFWFKNMMHHRTGPDLFELQFSDSREEK